MAKPGSVNSSILIGMGNLSRRDEWAPMYLNDGWERLKKEFIKWFYVFATFIRLKRSIEMVCSELSGAWTCSKHFETGYGEECQFTSSGGQMLRCQFTSSIIQICTPPSCFIHVKFIPM